jgi:hypothetical protein
MLSRSVYYFGIALLTGLAPAGCASVPRLELPDSPAQGMYRSGVPHTDREGRRLMGFDAGRSFLPIGIYHGLQGDHFGRHYDLADLAAAGFNTAHLWPVQDMPAALAAAQHSGLQVIVPDPAEARIDAVAGHRAILAWLGEDEPTQFVPAAETTARIAAFQATRARIQARDMPDRPVFVMEPAGIARQQQASWRQWIVQGDVAVHFNYPYVRQLAPVRTIERVAVSVRRAVQLNDARKPVWFVYQAFAGQAGWTMPEPVQMRSMVYAALIHGATGFIAFGLDSHAMRDGDVVGIAPQPVASYGPTPDYDKSGRPPLVVEDAQLAKSRRLWQAVEKLNGELKVLTSAILSPTAAMEIEVDHRGQSITPMPIRTLLKRMPDGSHVMFAVNLDDAPLDVSFRFPAEITAAKRRFYDGDEAVRDGGHHLRDSFLPFDVRVYDLQFASGS